jgi:hypothetical protein
MKIEALWRDLPFDGAEMTTMVSAFRDLYNAVRPYEHLAGDRPLERYLADPAISPPDASPATLSTRREVRIP